MKNEFYDPNSSLDKYYESQRALGEIFRYMDSQTEDSLRNNYRWGTTYDPIYDALNPDICEELDNYDDIQSPTERDPQSIIDAFRDKLKYISASCIPTGVSKERLTEEELILGIIAAK